MSCAPVRLCHTNKNTNQFYDDMYRCEMMAKSVTIEGTTNLFWAQQANKCMVNRYGWRHCN